jgi:hypothetical protein
MIIISNNIFINFLLNNLVTKMRAHVIIPIKILMCINNYSVITLSKGTLGLKDIII